MLKVAEEEEWATISIQEEGPRPVAQVEIESPEFLGISFFRLENLSL